MKNSSFDAVMAQGAEQFNHLLKQAEDERKERLKHGEIMKKLEEVRGYTDMYYPYYDDPYYETIWREKMLSLEELTEIMNRGRHDEIMHMIYHYNHAISGDEQKARNIPGYFLLPEEIEEMLAKRNNPEEIKAYLEVQSFGARAQNVILERKDPDEILSYIHRYAFLPEQQKKLFKLDLPNAVEEHIRSHGLCDELLDDIFAKLKAGDKKPLRDFMALHNLSVKYEKELVLAQDVEMFSDYISCYECLSKEAEETLALEGNSELKLLYIDHIRVLCVARREHKHHCKDFLANLLKQRPLDYEVILKTFLAIPAEYYACDNCIKDNDLMQHGTSGQVVERIAKKKPLHLESLGFLFFRNEPNLFEAYLDNCSNDVFFKS